MDLPVRFHLHCNDLFLLLVHTAIKDLDLDVDLELLDLTWT